MISIQHVYFQKCCVWFLCVTLSVIVVELEFLKVIDFPQAHPLSLQLTVVSFLGFYNIDLSQITFFFFLLFIVCCSVAVRGNVRVLILFNSFAVVCNLGYRISQSFSLITF